MVLTAGLEPASPGFGNPHSSPLSYVSETIRRAPEQVMSLSVRSSSIRALSKWSYRSDLNRQVVAYKATAVPLSHDSVERVKGFEPSMLARLLGRQMLYR